MKNLSLNAKVIILLAIMALGGTVSTLVGLSRLSEMDHTLQSTIDVVVKRALIAREAESYFLRMAVAELYMMLEDSPEGVTKFYKDIETNKQKLDVASKEFHELAADFGKTKITEFKAACDAWVKESESVHSLAVSGKRREAYEHAKSQQREKRLAAQGAITEIMTFNEKVLHETEEHADQQYTQAKSVVILVGTLSLLLAVALSFVILRSLSKSIDGIIRSLTSSANKVGGASESIAASSEELSQATSEQASSLQETASAIEEMNSMIKRNSENAKETSRAAASSETSATEGKKVVEDMIHAIQEISQSNAEIMTQITQSNREIAEINQVISEIGNKTKVINDIVFQTKLLSFNASVEAARAGEHGKGFAVVAEEVGKLAQMSGNAAKEIGDMLDSSIQKVDQIVNGSTAKVGALVETGKAKVEAGTTIARQCGGVLESIVKSVSQVSQLGAMISAASEEQARGAQEITVAMGQLNQVTQQNSTASHSTANAAEELAKETRSLNSVIATLVETIQGTDSANRQGSRVGMGVSAARVPRHTFKAEIAPAPVAAKMAEVEAPEVKAPKVSLATPHEDDPRFTDL